MMSSLAKKFIIALIVFCPISCWKIDIALSSEISDLSDDKVDIVSKKSLPEIKIIRFNPLSFLEKVALEIADQPSKKYIQTFVAESRREKRQHNKDRQTLLTDSNRDLKTTDLCWKALKRLKAQIITSKKLGNLPFCYLTMAKLYLDDHKYPSFELSSEYKIHENTNPEGIKNRLNSYLRERLKYFNLSSVQEKGKSKMYKWSLLYQAMLCMDDVKYNSQSNNKEQLILEAFRHLIKASELKTTKSVHVLLAHLYHEHGSYLSFYTEEEKQDLLEEHLAALDQVEEERKETLNEKKTKKAHPIPSFWEIVAKPPYYNERTVQNDIGELLRQLETEEIEDGGILHHTQMLSDDENDIMEIIEDESGYTKLDAKIQAAYDQDALKGEISEDLSQLLNERFPNITNTKGVSSNKLRLILFLDAQNIPGKTIAEKPLIDWGQSTISRLLSENGIHHNKKYDVDTINAIFDAHLSTGYRVGGEGKKGIGPIANAIAQDLHLEPNTLQQFLYNRFNTNKVSTEPPSKKQRLQIVKLYKEGKKYSAIKEETGSCYKHIFEVLITDLSEEERPKIINPSKIKLKPLVTKEREQKNTNTSKSLKKKDKGKKNDTRLKSKNAEQLKKDRIENNNNNTNTNTNENTKKQKRQITSDEISDAYGDLTPEEINDAVPHLSKELSLDEAIIEEALRGRDTIDSSANEQKSTKKRKLVLYDDL